MRHRSRILDVDSIETEEKVRIRVMTIMMTKVQIQGREKQIMVQKKDNLTL
jgi:hypothetical protein